MSKAVTDGATTTGQTDAAGVQLPPDLLAVIRTGAVFAGEPVTEIVIITVSGRRQRLQLPTPPDKTAGGLSRSKRKIMDVLRASPVPLTRLAVAHRCGLEDATGRFGSNVRELMGSGLIYSNGEDVTDDPGKFS
jgi:hypothetical protein